MSPKAPDDVAVYSHLTREWNAALSDRILPLDALCLISAGSSIPSLIPVIMVDYCWDLLFQPPKPNLHMAYATDLQRQMCHGEGPVVGSPMLAWLTPAAPTDFVFFIPKLRRSRGIVWALAWAARRFAHRHALRLVGMTRQKHGRSGVPFMDAWAPIVNTPMWPPPVQRALQTAAAALHCQSGVHFECVAGQVPTYCVTWPQTPNLPPSVAAIMRWKRRELVLGSSWIRTIRTLNQDKPTQTPPLGNYEENYLGPRDCHARIADYCEEVAQCAS